MATRGEVGGGSGVRASRRRGRGEDAIRGGERARGARGGAARRRSGRRRGIRGPVGGPVARARAAASAASQSPSSRSTSAQKVRLGQERVVAARANERVEGGQRRAHATETELGDGAVVPVVTRRGFGGTSPPTPSPRTGRARPARDGAALGTVAIESTTSRPEGANRGTIRDSRPSTRRAPSRRVPHRPPRAVVARRASAILARGGDPHPAISKRATLVSSTSERARLGRAHESNLRSSTRRV